MLRIDSVSNEKIKLAVKIASSTKHRRQNRLFFLEGLRLCRDAAITGCSIESFFVGEKAAQKLPEDTEFISSYAENSYIIGQSVEDKLALTDTSQGFFCLCRIPDDKNTQAEKGRKYIALENIQDPSNLGAISRSAEALGIDALIVQGGCDIYSPKAQRAAMGSLLRLPVISTDSLAALLEDMKAQGVKVYATTPDENAKDITCCDMSGSVICVIGNEGNGVSDEVFHICEKITIPMKGRAESLNASVAAAVTMWEMVR